MSRFSDLHGWLCNSKKKGKCSISFVTETPCLEVEPGSMLPKTSQRQHYRMEPSKITRDEFLLTAYVLDCVCFFGMRSDLQRWKIRCMHQITFCYLHQQFIWVLQKVHFRTRPDRSFMSTYKITIHVPMAQIWSFLCFWAIMDWLVGLRTIHVLTTQGRAFLCFWANIGWLVGLTPEVVYCTYAHKHTFTHKHTHGGGGVNRVFT